MSDKELRDVERFARQKGKEAAQPLPSENKTMIRYSAESIGFDDNGDYVKYTDHAAALAEKEAALAAERAKVRELVEALENLVEQLCNLCERGRITGFDLADSALGEDMDDANTLIEKYKEEPNNE